MTVLVAGCEKKRDLLAEHRAALREKAIAELKKKALNDLSLDILVWDISDRSNHRDVRNFIRQQKGVDVVAVAGSRLKAPAVAGMVDANSGYSGAWLGYVQAFTPLGSKHASILGDGSRFELA